MPPHTNPPISIFTMFDLWNSLQRITHYEYESTPGSKSVMGWEGHGSGSVTIDPDGSLLYFKETGRFTLTGNGYQMRTQNEFIWEQLSDTRIKLRHSRLGRDNQVELFDLVYNRPADQWLSESAHVCGEDLYSGKAESIADQIHFLWTISGPRKQENLHYCYAR
jgi:hypothetical protein